MAENTENWTKLESDSRYPRKYEFEELEQVVSNLQELDFINYKGTVDNYADLAGLTELENGDAYVNIEDGLVYVWNGIEFPVEGDGIDVSMKPIGVVEEVNEFAVSGGEVYKVLAPLISTNIVVDKINGYLNNNGEHIYSPNWETSTYFIDVLQGEILYYTGSTIIGGVAQAVCGYDENGVFIEIIIGTIDAQEKVSFSVNNPAVKKIRACSQKVTPPLQIFKISGGGGSSVLGKKQMNRSWRAVGMSIWASDETTYRGYQTLIKEQYEFTGYSKYCYSGRSLGGLTSGDTSSVLNMTGWVGTENDIWTLDTNTNDFKRNIPIGTISDYNNNTGITTFYGALRVFKDKVATLSPNAIVICSNALRRNSAGYTSTSTNTVGATLLDYEKAVMTIASLNDWYFVDQFRMSGITDETLSITTTDNLHLNNFGYTLAVLPWIPYFETIYLKQF